MLIVAPLAEVARLCAERQPSHLVSWLSPPDELPRIASHIEPPHRLHISSHDIIAPEIGLTPPSLEQVDRLLSFARGWDERRPLLVHCWAGISRSTAAAFAIACQRRPTRPELDIAAELRRGSPMATPNLLIVQLADQLLERRGRMVEAVATIGRGVEAPLGAPFEFDLGG
jgi:predicted protein tyrosine phosphatase